eukprot:TRINITY_DN28089_c0_g1_i1.p1 TRINITY_DN28089_c0_g1~~TRINITY_DN28089_c0_g1_i1.p1  ORF type:complete len:707 (-),score=46.53 TRINITY_DN28089_c0_g1_i1:308-2428(-)
MTSGDETMPISSSFMVLERCLATCTTSLHEANQQLKILSSEPALQFQSSAPLARLPASAEIFRPSDDGDVADLDSRLELIDSEAISNLPGMAQSTSKRSSAHTLRSSDSITKREDSMYVIHKMWRGRSTTVGNINSMPMSASGDDLNETSIAAALGHEMDHHESVLLQIDRYSKYVLHPESNIRGLWDVGGCMFVGYDLLFLPIQLLNPPTSTFVSFMSWITRLYWSVDILMSFASGYITSSGQIQLVLSKIAKRYLCTWFILDIAIVLLDWIDLLFPEDNFDAETARVGKATRILRIMRLLRLLRVLRIISSVSIVQERLQQNSEGVKLMSEISKTLATVLILAHFIGCAWFGIADACRDAGTTYWFEHKPNFANDFYLRYITSVHWALAQFQGGMDEFVPHNAYERSFVVWIAVLTFAVSTGIISRLTSLMTQLYILSRKEAQQFSLLRTYLRQNGISTKLASRINRSVKFNIDATRARIQERTVELLDLVSDGLRIELDFERYTRVYSLHRFFGCYTEECPLVMRRVCHQGSTIKWLTDGETIFTGGECLEQPKMYVLMDGKLTYIDLCGRTASLTQDGNEPSSERNFICEHAVWTAWIHSGLLKSAQYTTLCELDLQTFHAVATRFDSADFDPRRYASIYLQILNSRRDEVSDLAMMLTMEEEEELCAALIYKNASSRGGSTRFRKVFSKVRARDSGKARSS